VVASAVTVVHCQPVPAWGIATCIGKVHAQTGQLPPEGIYTAEFEVIGAYGSQSPGTVYLDVTSSGAYAHCPTGCP
jgi:hypothetical protein